MRNYFLLLVLFISSTLNAQQFDRIKLHYQNMPLVKVLDDLEQKYQLHFAYTSQHLRLSQKITVNIQEQTLEKALKDLFDYHNIAYAQIGQQWALKNGKPKILPPKPVVAPKKQLLPKEKPLTQVSEPIEPVIEKIFSAKPIRPLTVNTILIDGEKQYNIEQTVMQRFRSDVQAVFDSWKTRKATGQLNVFQVSTLGTRKKASQKANIIGFGLGWGIHGSIEGVQVSTLGTVIRRNSYGLQVGGLFNSVGKNSYGLQIAGLFNTTHKDLIGLQISSLLNRSKKVYGGQLSLGFNWADGRLTGTQIAGLGNVALESTSAVQVASLFNVTQEKANLQLAAVYNQAQEITGIQLSGGVNQTKKLEGVQLGLVNKAKKVKGVQVGLVNVTDSTQGVSFGLINIVKKGGYNKLEVASGESIHAVFSAKIGPQSLYQIYQGGFNLWSRAWGLGWGVGTVLPSRLSKWDMNIELIAMHINEDQKWTPKLNLLTQARYLFEYKLDTGFSIFLGPSCNLMLSKYRDPETKILGSSVPMYSLIEGAFRQETQLTFWLGFQTGVRMNLW